MIFKPQTTLGLKYLLNIPFSFCCYTKNVYFWKFKLKQEIYNIKTFREL